MKIKNRENWSPYASYTVVIFLNLTTEQNINFHFGLT